MICWNSSVESKSCTTLFSLIPDEQTHLSSVYSPSLSLMMDTRTFICFFVCLNQTRLHTSTQLTVIGSILIWKTLCWRICSLSLSILYVLFSFRTKKHLFLIKKNEHIKYIATKKHYSTSTRLKFLFNAVSHTERKHWLISKRFGNSAHRLFLLVVIYVQHLYESGQKLQICLLVQPSLPSSHSSINWLCRRCLPLGLQ
jgi:hypothetical protein